MPGGTAARGYLLKERISHFDQLSEAVHQVAETHETPPNVTANWPDGAGTVWRVQLAPFQRTARTLYEGSRAPGGLLLGQVRRDGLTGRACFPLS